MADSSTVHEWRLAHLQALIDLHKSVADLCRRGDFNPTYISQVQSGFRNMGSGYARRMEEYAGLPRGTFDRPPASDATLDILEQLSDDELVETIVKALPRLSKDGSKQVSLALLTFLASDE